MYISGKLAQGSTILNSTKGKKERVGRLIRMYADRREDIDEVYAGDIAAILGLKDIISQAIHYQSHPTRSFSKISLSLNRLSPSPLNQKHPLTNPVWRKHSENFQKKTPHFRVHTDAVNGQTIIEGMGELHLDVLVDRMLREFRVHANVGRPRVAYRETITREVKKLDYRYVKQSGGHGQFGHVVINLEPVERGQGIVFRKQDLRRFHPKRVYSCH